MGSINQAIVQLRDLLASMTPAARITAVLLLGVIGVSLGYLMKGYGGAADEYLFEGEVLSYSEANNVEAAIAKAGLAKAERDGGRIRVPRGQKAEYLAAVANEGALPANFHEVMEKALNLGPFVDRETRAQRIKSAREQQLSMMVGNMQGVDFANVLYDVREAPGFGKEHVTATVSVQPEAGESLDARRVKMIRGAVASGIGGLSEDVTVTNLADGSSYDMSGAPSGEEFDEPYFQTRVAYEQMLRRNIMDFLHDIPGVRVQVSAELDDVLDARTRSTSSSGDAIALRDSNKTEEIKNTKVEDGGRPGLAAQGPNRAAAEQAVAKNESSTITSNTESDNFVPFSEEQLRRSGLVPKHVRAAIAVPSDYLVRVWKQKNPDKEPADSDLQNAETVVKDKIVNTVTTLFPKETGENPYPNVQVTVFESLKPDPVAAPSVLSRGFVWAGANSGSLIMAGLAVTSLVMLRSMVKSIPPAETRVLIAPRLAEGTAPSSPGAASSGGVYAAASAAEGGVAAPAKPHVEKARPKLKLKKSGSLKDDLADMVREDPDSAAAILKSWISNAS